MSRYISGSDSFSYRMPIVLDTATTPPATSDVTVTIPADDQFFWSTVHSTGNDIRVTSADGRTLLTYQFNPAFNYANRACTLEIEDGAPISSATGRFLWLYWGNSTVSAPGGSFVYAAAYTGYTVVGHPFRSTPYRYEWSPDRYGATKATPTIQKQASETIVVALRYRGALIKRVKPYAGGLEQEEPLTFEYAVYDGASAQAAMIDATAIRADDQYVYLIVKAGTTATEYTLRVTMTTHPGSNTGLTRVLIWSATLNVLTLTE